MTAHDCYQMIVGRGGQSAEYFLYELRMADAQWLIDGINDMTHSGWEQARFVSWIITKVMGNKEGLDSIAQFPWENDNNTINESDAAYYEQLKKEMVEHNRKVMLKKKINGKKK